MIDRQVIKFPIIPKQFVYLQLHVVCNLRGTHHIALFNKVDFGLFIYLFFCCSVLRKTYVVSVRDKRLKRRNSSNSPNATEPKIRQNFIAGILSNEKCLCWSRGSLSIRLSPGRRREESASRRVAVNFPCLQFSLDADICHTQLSLWKTNVPDDGSGCCIGSINCDSYHY